MDGDGWERVREHLANVLEMETAERAEYLDRLAAEDPAAAIEVAELLLENVGDTTSAAVLEWKEIGGYELIREIGRGGTSIVFAARKEGLRRTVALKLLLSAPNGLSGSDEFRREQESLSQLRHPGIVGLLDGGLTAGGLPYLVLELVEGVPIDVYCQERCSTLRAQVEQFAQLCDAVAAAHAAGIVHRDIKPANVLVDAAGAPRLLDFGVAKVYSAAASSRSPAMTLAFASPEQVLGKAVTPASDVYSLGALGYRIVTGASPYGIEDGNLLALSREICEGEWTPPKEYRLRGARYAADRRLNLILERCLRRPPGDRYASAGALGEDLRRWLAGGYVELNPVEMLFRGVVRYRFELLGAAAMIAVLVMLAVNHQKETEARERTVARESMALRVRATTVRLIHSNLEEIQKGMNGDDPLPPERRKFLMDTMASMDTLRAAGEDAKLLYDLGVAYSLLSRIEAGDDAAREEAVRQTLQAQRCFYRLHEAAPAEVAYVLALSRNYLRMAELFSLNGDGKGAFAAYREAGSYLRNLPPTIEHKRLTEAVERKEAEYHLALARTHSRNGWKNRLEEAEVLLFLADAELRNDLEADARRSCEAAERVLRAESAGSGVPDLGTDSDLRARIEGLREYLGRRMAARAGWK